MNPRNSLRRFIPIFDRIDRGLHYSKGRDPVWKLAADRIAACLRLLAAKNFSLRRPFEVDCYGNHFVLR